MKNIIKTGFGAAFVVLGIIAFVFAIVSVILCAAGFALIAETSKLLIKIKKSFHAKVTWWASTKHELNHSLEELGHVLRILH